MLDGLTYSSVPLEPSLSGWLALLHNKTPGFAPQPYDQLASVHRAAGYERNVRLILLSKKRHEAESGLLTGRQRMWTRLSGPLFGYGYETWRIPVLGLPLLKTNARNQCEVTNEVEGQILTVSGWVLQVLAWGFGAWFIVIFTGLVRSS
jgi:hypothetical protein